MTGTQGIPMPCAIVFSLAFNQQGHPGDDSSFEAFARQSRGSQFLMPFARQAASIHPHEGGSNLRTPLLSRKWARHKGSLPWLPSKPFLGPVVLGGRVESGASCAHGVRSHDVIGLDRHCGCVEDRETSSIPLSQITGGAFGCRDNESHAAAPYSSSTTTRRLAAPGHQIWPSWRRISPRCNRTCPH